MCVCVVWPSKGGEVLFPRDIIHLVELLGVILQLQNQTKNKTPRRFSAGAPRKAHCPCTCERAIGRVPCSLATLNWVVGRENWVNLLGSLFFSFLSFVSYLEVNHRPGSPVLERCEIVGPRRRLLFIIRTCTSPSPTQDAFNHTKLHETKKWQVGNCTAPHHANTQRVGGASSPSLLRRKIELT